MPRHKTLKFKGEWIERRDDAGNIVVSGPSQSFEGVPARNLTEDDVKGLTDEQYRNAVDSGLYEGPRSTTQSDAKNASASKSELAALRNEAAVLGLAAPRNATRAQLTKLIDEAGAAEPAPVGGDANASDQGGPRAE